MKMILQSRSEVETRKFWVKPKPAGLEQIRGLRVLSRVHVRTDKIKSELDHQRFESLQILKTQAVGPGSRWLDDICRARWTPGSTPRLRLALSLPPHVFNGFTAFIDSHVISQLTERTRFKLRERWVLSDEVDGGSAGFVNKCLPTSPL